MGREVGCGLQILLPGAGFGALEHHVAAGAFLGVEPEIPPPGLAQADPLVLAMVAAHLQPQAPGAAQFERLGGGGLAAATALTLAGLELLLDLLFQVPQGPDRFALLQECALIEEMKAGLQPVEPLPVLGQAGFDRGHRAAQAAGLVVELLGLGDDLLRRIPLAEQSIGLQLQRLAAGGGLQQAPLQVGVAALPVGRRRQPLPQGRPTLFKLPAGQPGAVVVRQGPVDRTCGQDVWPGIHRLRLLGPRGSRPRGLGFPVARLRAITGPADPASPGLIANPAAVIAATPFAVLEPLLLNRQQPASPVAVQGLPVGGLEIRHGPLQQRQPVLDFNPIDQLPGQARADALVGVLQGPLQRQGYQAEAAAPVVEGFLASGRLAGQWWRGAVGVAGADRPQPRLLWPHLSPGRHHPSPFIEQEEVAAAAHQFQHQPALIGLPRPPGEAQLHHPLPALLFDRHQRQTPQAVLQLLGQGAALPLPGRSTDAVESGCLRLPPQLDPPTPLQAPQGQLQGVGIALLGLLKAARQQAAPQFGEQGPQGGCIDRLDRRHGSCRFAASTLRPDPSVPCPPPPAPAGSP